MNRILFVVVFAVSIVAAKGSLQDSLESKLDSTSTYFVDCAAFWQIHAEIHDDQKVEKIGEEALQLAVLTAQKIRKYDYEGAEALVHGRYEIRSKLIKISARNSGNIHSFIWRYLPRCADSVEPWIEFLKGWPKR